MTERDDKIRGPMRPSMGVRFTLSTVWWMSGWVWMGIGATLSEDWPSVWVVIMPCWVLPAMWGIFVWSRCPHCGTPAWLRGIIAVPWVGKTCSRCGRPYAG